MSYQTEADRQRENEVAEVLKRAWDCELRRFARFSPLDFYAVKGGSIVAVLELKNRRHLISRYPTVFLSLRKWLALMLTATGIGVPGIFVVRFVDGIRWVSVMEINASQLRIGGAHKLDGDEARDREPLIEVPVAAMRALVVPEDERAA